MSASEVLFDGISTDGEATRISYAKSAPQAQKAISGLIDSNVY